jgi:hypothetical protein
MLFNVAPAPGILIGPVYSVDDTVGVEPFEVYLIVAPAIDVKATCGGVANTPPGGVDIGGSSVP